MRKLVVILRYFGPCGRAKNPAHGSSVLPGAAIVDLDKFPTDRAAIGVFGSLQKIFTLEPEGFHID